MTQEIQARHGWLQTGRPHKETFLRALEGVGGHHFQFQELRRQQTPHGEQDIGIFVLDGHEFVFVPGDEVTLGWGELDPADAFIVPAITGDLETLAWGASSTLAAMGYPLGVVDYLRHTLSPRRQVQIPPLLVEREAPLITERDGRLVTLDPHTDNILGDAFRYDAVLDHLARQGFSLPTEDEWEYLCGGGTTRLFGDYVEESVIREVCAISPRWMPLMEGALRKPSGRGVYIAYDGQAFELVDAPCLVKGADGGIASCGGYSFLALLTVSPHFRLEGIHELCGPERWFDDAVRARRVLRLGSLSR